MFLESSWVPFRDVSLQTGRHRLVNQVRHASWHDDSTAGSLSRPGRPTARCVPYSQRQYQKNNEEQEETRAEEPAPLPLLLVKGA